MTETDRIRLRALEPYDIDLLYKWENDSRLWEAGSTVAPFSRKILLDYIENYNPDIFSARQLRLMIESKTEGMVVGTIDIYDFDPTNRRAMIGFIVDFDFRDKGYAAEAISLTATYCKQRLGMHQLAAITAIDNIPSRKTLENSGFKISGRLQSWLVRQQSYVDAFLYQKLL